MKPKTAELQVIESLEDDVEKGIARFDTSIMNKIGIKPGDPIEISGNRKTLAIAERAWPGDAGYALVRIDGLMRYNAATTIGEIVKISKAKVKPAKSINLASAINDGMFSTHPEILKLFINNLFGMVITQGDIVVLNKGRPKALNPLLERMMRSMRENQNFADPISEFISHVKARIQETVPEGFLRITENTKISFIADYIDRQKTESEQYIIDSISQFKSRIASAKSKGELEKVKKDIKKVRVRVAEHITKFLDDYKLMLAKNIEEKAKELNKTSKNKLKYRKRTPSKK